MRKFLLLTMAITIGLTSCTKVEPTARVFEWNIIIRDSNGVGQKLESRTIIVQPVVNYDSDSTESYNQLIDSDFEPTKITDSYLIY